MRKDDDGQMSIDFLIGVTIFILAFIFLMMAIPQMFTPFQSNSDQLTMIADKIGATLVENELVANDPAGQPLPGIISSTQINTLKNTLTDPTTELNKRIELGLSKGDPANPNDVYHIQIELDEYDPAPNGLARQIPTIIFPSTFPAGSQIGSQNVGQSRRFVYVRDPQSIGDATEYWPGVRTIMVVRVW